MSLKFLQTVLKTVSIGSVKLTTPADRVGFGVQADIDADYPANILSPGHIPLPRLSDPEPDARSRQEVADVMSMPPSGTADHGPSGSGSGTPPRRLELACLASIGSTLPGSTSTAARFSEVGKPASAIWHAVGAGRASRQGFRQRQRRIGRDCQSPDRQTANRLNPTASASNRGWRRTARPAPAGRK
ncbi:MAG: hypothetical protein ACRC7O_18955 [Fimbriiglobus sp.]